MDNMNSIGLHEGSASQLAEKLNHLLANYQIFYMNVRGYHWNVKGNDFFELHAKFEEFYTDLLTKVDESTMARPACKAFWQAIKR